MPRRPNCSSQQYSSCTNDDKPTASAQMHFYNHYLLTVSMGTNCSNIQLTSQLKSWTMVGLLKILLKLSPYRASQTAFQWTLNLRGTLRAASNPATVDDKFNVTPSDAWSDLSTLLWTCTSHRSGTFVRTRSNTQRALWVGQLNQLRTVSNSGEIKSSYTMHEHQWCMNPATLSADSWNQVQNKIQTKDRPIWCSP